MTVIDTIEAGQLEASDSGAIISVDGDEYQIISVSESNDLHEVLVSAYNLTTGDTESLPLPYDYSVNILGA